MHFVDLREGFQRALAPALAIALLVPGVASGDELSAPQKERAGRLIEQLASDDFSARIAAGAELEALPVEALPLFEEAIERCGPGELDLRARLKSIVRKLKLRSSEALLRTGTPVKIDLKAAGPAEVLQALRGAVDGVSDTAVA